MATYTIKCANCNIVINELLAFIQNKADVMDEESLARICCDCFSEEDIVVSKRLLFESVPTAKRVIRRNKGKNVRDIDDIISLLKQTDPELVPTFVARDLQKLPPVTFDHVDVTKLLKDIILLQVQVRSFPKEYVTSSQLLEVKNEIEALKKASIVNDFINTRRVATYRNVEVNTFDSGPMALQQSIENTPSPQIIQNSENIFSPNIEGTPTCHNIGCVTAERVPISVTAHSPLLPRYRMQGQDSAVSLAPTDKIARISTTCKTDQSIINRSLTERSSRNNSRENISSITPITKKTAAETLRDTVGQRSQNMNDGWKKVEYKKRKNKLTNIKIGKANIEPDGKFKAADIKLPIFISNVSKHTTEDDILEYIKNNTNEEVFYDIDYSRDYFIVPNLSLSRFLMTENRDHKKS
ncbi:unnamed protein product [Diatraea saccharalis]|uniref:Uncharacterized protein n=1 Tax=Diatraea saccharalis TaxID=40085 RepID=A0A9P0C7N6_9NEOP|nr:unnamed protein product [Diatraea saccharalis]